MELGIILLFFLSIIGGIFSIPTLIPPLRRRARANQGFRIGLILVCSLAAWIIPTLPGAYMGGVTLTASRQVDCGSAVFDRNFYGNCDGLPVDAELVDSLEREMGYRAMMPPPLENHCFTGIPEVCRAADLAGYESTWTSYLWGWLGLSIFGIVTAFFGWYLTRAVEKEKRKHGE